MNLSVPDTLAYIDTPSGLNDVIEDLRKEPVVAFDLEADSMFHFREKVCLIQTATPSSCYIIDPLSIPDMSPLAQILSNPDITKIFHGADYDVRSLYRDYQIVIHNLFDTELASRFLGKSETGLNTVLKNRFDITLEKKYQKKDWSQRPLPEAMIQYAAKDVHYLIPLFHVLKKELLEKGRLDWVMEECRDLTQVRSGPINERPLFAKIKGAGHLDRRSLAILEALLEFRLEVAEAKDRPLFKIISNVSLSKIAAARPPTMKALIKSKALSDKQQKMYGQQILAKIRKALAVSSDKLPQYPYTRTKRHSSDVSRHFQDLKKWRENKAAALQIEPGMLINNTLLKSIAESHPETPESLDAIPALKNWQKNVLGKEMISILKQAEMP